MKKVVFLFFYVFAICIVFCQNENNMWYFGTNAGLDFNGIVNPTPPTTLSGNLNTQEGVATISDSNGNLLFYSDGSNIWDATSSIMPNGNGLSGSWSATQSCTIVPHPGDPDKYFVFTVGAVEDFPNMPLSYSIVDMNLVGNGTSTNPLGDIPAGVANKNVLLNNSVVEKIVATPKCDTDGY